MFVSNTSGGAGYRVQRSLRFRSSASAYLSRVFPSVGSSATTKTLSMVVKRGAVGAVQGLAESNAAQTYVTLLQFDAGDTLTFNFEGASPLLLTTTQVFRDPSAHLHILLAIDTTQAVASNRVKLYINGVQVTSFSTASYPAQNATTSLFGYNSTANTIGAQYTGTSQYYDGYLSEVNFIDGQALDPTYFGAADPIIGQWLPKKYTGTYGTNGFYLDFRDPTSATTLCHDRSGNGNNWTPTNISTANDATYDSMLDVPTAWVDGGNGRGNYATLNPLQSALALSAGNLQSLQSASAWASALATIFVNSGKWYWESTISSGNSMIGIAPSSTTLSTYIGAAANGYGYYITGDKYNNGVISAYGSAITAGSVVGVALDLDAGTVTYYNNNVSQGVAATGLTGYFAPAVSNYTSDTKINFGQRPFAYTPPAGFKALHTGNLPTPSIKKPKLHFNPVLYVGDSSTNKAITGVGFQPDLVWIKNRVNAYDHQLFDVNRGLGSLASSSATAEQSYGNFNSFDLDGFSVDITGSVSTNTSGAAHVAWNWKAGGAPVANSAGSISSQVSANVQAGFSIVTYTGTGVNATVGHGLGVAPKMVVFKPRNAVDNWPVWHGSFAVNEYAYLNLTNAKASLSTFQNSTLPSSTVLSLGTWANVNANTQTMVAYCFSEIPGYSKFGSYTGNGSADGPFVYCGFRPRWVLVKRTDSTSDWRIIDTARDTYNVASAQLYPDLSNAEASGAMLDVTASGFKVRNTDTGYNGSGGTYIFAAFAEAPFQYANAR